MKPEVKKTMLMLLGNTVLLLLVYYCLPSLISFSYLPTIYLLLGGALGLYYVIYNRGFSGKNVTPDMLPDTMTAEEKHRFIEDSKLRLQKSKWVLTILIPLMLVFAIDMIYLYVIPTLFGGAS